MIMKVCVEKHVRQVLHQTRGIELSYLTGILEAYQRAVATKELVEP